MHADETLVPGDGGTPGSHGAGLPRTAGGIAGALEEPGAEVGPYRLVRLLGEGGFGTVWLAERRHPFVQQVALKIVKAGMDSKAVVARFEQERQALAVMNHPNVAKVLDGGLTALGRPYFAMEYVKGSPINEFCDRRTLPVNDRLTLFLQVCDAVQHAHTKGIIHRDLKPSNILVSQGEDDQPSAKVIDFGIAKAVTGRMTEQTLFTENGQMIGTPEYMSPEQADPGETDIDTRTDVYSLGVILYELLSGALPFDPKDLRSRAYREIQRVIREDDPPAPSARLSTIATKDAELATRIGATRRQQVGALATLLRTELEWIPLKAMRKDRQERYDSPADLGRDVENYLAGRPLVAAPESAAYRVRKYVRRNRVVVVATAAVFVALVVGLGAAAWQFRSAIAARERSEYLVGVLSMGNALDAARRHDALSYLSELEDIAGAGRESDFAARLARSIADRSIGGFSIAGRDGREPIDGRLPRELNAFALSPDGRMIAVASHEPGSYGRGDNEILLIDAGSGARLRAPLRGHDGTIRGLGFSPDGRLLASCADDRSIRLWNPASGLPVGEPLWGDAGGPTLLVFSPDGTRLASAHDRGGVLLWDVATGRRHPGPLPGRTKAGRVTAMAFGDHGRSLVVAWNDGMVRRWQVDAADWVGPPLEGHEGAVLAIAISPDGSAMATCGMDETIRRWDTQAGTQLGAPIRGHRGPVTAVAFSHDGRTIASSGTIDMSVRLWDAASGVAHGEPLFGSLGAAGLLRFDQDGRALTSVAPAGLRGPQLRRWDLDDVARTGDLLRGHRATVLSLAFSADGQTIVTGACDGTVRLWDSLTGSPLGQPFRPTDACISDVAISPDGSYVAGIAAGMIHRWSDLNRGTVLAPPPIEDSEVSAIAFSPDGRLLACAQDNLIRFLDSETGAVASELSTTEILPDRITWGDRSPGVTIEGSRGIEVEWDPVRARPTGRTWRGAGRDRPLSSDDRTAVCRQGGFPVLVDALADRRIGAPLEQDGYYAVAAFDPSGDVLAIDHGSVVRLWHAAPYRERYPAVRALRAKVALVRDALSDRIAAVGDTAQDVAAFDAEVRADTRFAGDLRRAALIVVGEVSLDREDRRTAPSPANHSAAGPSAAPVAPEKSSVPN